MVRHRFARSDKRRSSSRWPAVRRARGFTAVEMVIVLVILGVLVTLAAPSFVNMIRSQRIKTAANDLVSTLTFARSEAVKRNADVTVTRTGGSWANGWSVTYVDSGTKTARIHPSLKDLTVTTTTTSLVFSGGGRASAVANFTVDYVPQTAGVNARCVEIGLDGVPRVWIERGGNHVCTDD
jgi:type IV fimbrial biogenesis protein FimT